jgi:ClpP class serine protease
LAGEEKSVNEKVKAAANALVDATDSDVLIYSGDIERPYDDRLLDELFACPVRRKNVILILGTYGGSPDAAYRIARGLQENYSRFTVLLAGRCKSAGTLLIVGAHEIVMTPHAELGPLDVQVGKKDELVGLDSGLTVLDALSQLENKAFNLFEDAMLKIVQSSNGRVTFKTATHIALGSGRQEELLSDELQPA